MNNNDLEYIFRNITSPKNFYPMDINFKLPDIHLVYLNENKINYKFNPAEQRYKRTIDILRKDNGVITTIKPPRYMTNSKVSYELVKNKLSTEKYLGKFHLNTPESSIYSIEDVDRAKDETFNNSEEPVVIKPYSGTLGKGVMVNVSESRFNYNWKQMLNQVPNTSKVIVQKFMEGFEARATITEGSLVSVTLRIPPFVVGDGTHNITQLIDLANKERKKCGVLGNNLIKNNYRVTEFLKSSNLPISHVPQQGERILLGSVSNVSNGGEMVNITDLVNDEIKETALNAIAALPGLFTGGVDIMMKSFDDTEPVVLEVNSFPVLGLAAFPTYGEQTEPSRNYIESVITIDQYTNDYEEKYEIKDKERYLSNYLNFIKRKKRLMDQNFDTVYEVYK